MRRGIGTVNDWLHDNPDRDCVQATTYASRPLLCPAGAARVGRQAAEQSESSRRGKAAEIQAAAAAVVAARRGAARHTTCVWQAVFDTARPVTE